VQPLSTMFALFSGEAGELADQMTDNVPMHLILFSGSLFNHVESWNEKFAKRFNKVHINNEIGSHLTGSDSGVIR
jgi:hypothetical protein